MTQAIKPGVVFSCTWGATMTLGEFYKVLKVSKTGKTATVVRLAKMNGPRREDDDVGIYDVVPDLDPLAPGGGTPMQRRLATDEEGVFFHPGSSRFYARPWNGKPIRENHLD